MSNFEELAKKQGFQIIPRDENDQILRGKVMTSLGKTIHAALDAWMKNVELDDSKKLTIEITGLNGAEPATASFTGTFEELKKAVVNGFFKSIRSPRDEDRARI